MKAPKFTAIEKPYMHGVQCTRPDGITVEAVRCYEGEWTVFLTRDSHVVACSIEAYRKSGHGNMPKADALAIAKSLTH